MDYFGEQATIEGSRLIYVKKIRNVNILDSSKEFGCFLVFAAEEN